jgi:hypothetical protein
MVRTAMRDLATARAAFVEPMFFARAGPETLRFEMQAGVWIPFYVSKGGEFGIPWPVLINFGLIWQPDFRGIGDR